MKITYDDKVSLTSSPLPRANKCTDDDLNEIKEVVNTNDDEMTENLQDVENIKDQIQNINDKFKYSTTEQQIGIWINNKPIYRKVFELSLTTEQTTKSVNIQSLSIENVIHIEGIAQTDPIATNYYWENIDKFRAYYNPINYNLYIQGGSDFPARPFTAYVIIEYTKTTD